MTVQWEQGALSFRSHFRGVIRKSNCQLQSISNNKSQLITQSSVFLRPQCPSMWLQSHLTRDFGWFKFFFVLQEVTCSKWHMSCLHITCSKWHMPCLHITSNSQLTTFQCNDRLEIRLFYNQAATSWNLNQARLSWTRLHVIFLIPHLRSMPI